LLFWGKTAKKMLFLGKTARKIAVFGQMIYFSFFSANRWQNSEKKYFAKQMC